MESVNRWNDVVDVGRLPRSSRTIRVLGDITYNGEKAHSGHFEIGSLATYVGQQDNHEPYLTVRETFEFAATCIGSVPSPEVSER